MNVRVVGICVKREQPQLEDPVRELASWFEARGIEVVLDPQAARWNVASAIAPSDLAAKADLVIALGGDGTLLAVARTIGDRPVPILGVNLGTLGYLVETASEDLYIALDQVLEGRFDIETRLSRMIDLETFADGVQVTTYHGDGLIAATPTGSTAYSLSAGGPLLLPELEAIVLTPISPHTLTQRPLVLPETCEVETFVRETRGGEVRLTVDGQVGCDLVEGDCVSVCRSPHSVRLLVPPGRNRFELMRAKLAWGAR
jgi:NAD+ kinase